jgi:hypothetical protein
MAAHKTRADTTEAVDVLLLALNHPATREIQALRAIVCEVSPSIQEGVKWNAPSFRVDEYFATINLREKQGVGVVLHFGAKVRDVAAGPESIDDPDKLLKWLAKDRATVRFLDMDDIVARKPGFQAVLRQWIGFVK